MIQHDLRFALDGVWMLPHMSHEQPAAFGSLYFIARRGFLVLKKLEVGAVSCIALEHIEDEALSDGLAHSVSVNWPVLDLLYAFRGHYLARLAEHFQRFSLGRRGEREKR